MSYELKTIDNAEEFSAAVTEIATGGRNELILGKWPGGVLEFAGIVFPGVDTDDIFATQIVREPRGREPHFDAYKSYIDEEKFWLGHYNLRGDADVVTTELATDLQEAYERRYPTQTEESGDARRLFSRIALTEPEARVGHGVMEAGTKMVLPIRPKGPHVVHDIVPADEMNPGEFVKIVVPTRSKVERSQLLAGGYKPLDSFITDSLGYAIPTKEKPEPKSSKPQEGSERRSSVAPVPAKRRRPRGYEDPRLSRRLD